MITSKIKAAAIRPGVPNSSAIPVFGNAVAVALGGVAVDDTLDVTVIRRCCAVWVSSALLVAIATMNVGDLVGASTMTGVLVGTRVLVGVKVGCLVAVAVGTEAVLMAD